MTDTANAPEREAGTPGPHEPDYKTAMLYHSDRADAYMGERDALTAELAKLRADLAEAQVKLNELQSDRPFIVGWNLGFAEAEYQQAHGEPSDGDLSPKYSFIFNEEEQRQFEAIRAALQENSNE